MIYAVSDLHGCYEKYLNLLSRINLSGEDVLYILGDIVDRGSGSMEIVLDLIHRKNVIALLGNHDYEASLFLRNFAVPNDGYYADGLAESFSFWLSDGGKPTYESFLEMDDEKRCIVLNYLSSLSFFRELTVSGRKFFLSHTVPEKEKMLKREECRMKDFLYGRAEYDRVYFEDTIIVTGHTPTAFIDPDFEGRIWKGNNHIEIDCGAVFGEALGCICLDTLEEIYVR